MQLWKKQDFIIYNVECLFTCSKKHLDDYDNRKDTPVKQPRKKLCVSAPRAN